MLVKVCVDKLNNVGKKTALLLSESQGKKPLTIWLIGIIPRISTKPSNFNGNTGTGKNLISSTMNTKEMDHHVNELGIYGHNEI